ncbi:PTS sugar transporter subunit IIA [Thermocrispum municipale]|uniref:PTS sugar transporter subunit IIA n=1 Tax=Thermocrispum municipale TaxID=37926 RepID=UPI000424B309
MTLSTDTLSAEAIRLGATAKDRAEAIEQCGRLLVDLGAVEEPYVAAMHEREKAVSTFVGEGVAIPHGTNEARQYVKRTQLAVVQYPDGIDWGAGTVHLCVAIAASGEEHVEVLAALSKVLMDEQKAAALRTATDAATVLSLLGNDQQEAHA